MHPNHIPTSDNDHQRGLTFSISLSQLDTYSYPSLSFPLSDPPSSPLHRVSGGMYHLPPLPRRFSNFSSNLRSAESFPCKGRETYNKKKASCKVISISFSRPVLYVQRFGIYQPYLILALDSSKPSCARHDMRDVGPVDRMCQQIARTSARNMNERVECVRLPQGLNERRLDNRQDKSKSPAATSGVAAKKCRYEGTWNRQGVASYTALCEPIS